MIIDHRIVPACGRRVTSRRRQYVPTLCQTAGYCCFVFSGSSAVRRRASAERARENFEQLWKTYDRNYALFGAKNIDWDALYKVYRPRVTSKTTDDELFQIISDMLGNLNDNHVGLISPGRRFQSGILGQMKMEDFSLDLAKQKYLKGKSKPLVDGVFDYGWLADSIGYFHFQSRAGHSELQARRRARSKEHNRG